MTATPNALVSRRTLVAGAAAALGVATLLAYRLQLLFGPHFAPTPYDDLLDRLPSRENAILLGNAVLANLKSFDAGAAATQLRARLKSGPFADALAGDLAKGQTVEVRGWILPESLTLLCALAARAS